MSYTIKAVSAITLVAALYTGMVARQWTNLRALVSRVDQGTEEMLSADQLAARARLMLDDKKKELATYENKVRITERQVNVREKNLASKQQYVETKRKELELAQRKLVLHADSTDLEVAGKSYSREVIEDDARRRLADLKRDVEAIEVEKNAVAQMRSDLASARSRLAVAVAAIESRELEVQTLLVRHRDAEAQQALKNLVPDLNNDSDLSATIDRLCGLCETEMPSSDEISSPDYGHELQTQNSPQDDIAAFLENRADGIAGSDSAR